VTAPPTPSAPPSRDGVGAVSYGDRAADSVGAAVP